MTTKKGGQFLAAFFICIEVGASKNASGKYFRTYFEKAKISPGSPTH
jgi:hypothetical protein